MNEIKEDLNKWSDIPVQRMEYSKLLYQFSPNWSTELMES